MNWGKLFDSFVQLGSDPGQLKQVISENKTRMVQIILFSIFISVLYSVLYGRLFPAYYYSHATISSLDFSPENQFTGASKNISVRSISAPENIGRILESREFLYQVISRPGMMPLIFPQEAEPEIESAYRAIRKKLFFEINWEQKEIKLLFFSNQADLPQKLLNLCIEDLGAVLKKKAFEIIQKELSGLRVQLENASGPEMVKSLSQSIKSKEVELDEISSQGHFGFRIISRPSDPERVLKSKLETVRFFALPASILITSLVAGLLFIFAYDAWKLSRRRVN